MPKMKKTVTWALAAACALVPLAGCAGGTNGTTTNEEAATAEQQESYTVDYGQSSVYKQEDIDAAVKVVMAEFDTWKGCTMKSISFTDDKTCADDVAYCNELKKDKSAPDFDQAMVLKSSFHSPSAEEVKGTAWEADTDYNDYEWHLARTGNGEWQLLTWGY